MRNKLKCILGAILIMVVSCNYLYATDAVLKWNASTGDVSGYIIYYGLSEGSYSYSMDAGDVTQYALSNLSLSEGMTYYFIVRAYNSVGESGDSNITNYTLPSSGDTIPPIPPEGMSGAVVNDSILIQWQANSEIDFSEYRVYYGTAIRSYGLPISVSGTEYSLTGLETDVTYYISVSAVDTSGNESGYSSPEVSVMYTLPDTKAPIVTITSPTTGTSYDTESDSISLIGTAIDDIGTSSVTWSNSRGGTGIASGTSSWSASGIALAEGDNVITVTAKDAAGNTSTDVLTVTYTIPDTTAPIVAITSPTTGSTYSVETSGLSISGTASDAGGVAQVTWSNSRGGSGTASGTENWTVSDISFGEGDNLITLTAIDDAGNTSIDTLTVTYIIPDTKAPIVTITSPTTVTSYDTEADSISLIGTATDDIGTSSVTWSNSRGGAGIASGTSSWSASGIALAEGDNVITVTAKDAAGNTSTDVLTVTYTEPVMVDTQSPEVILTRPNITKSNVVKKNYVNLAGTASDNVGIKEIRWENAQGGTSGTANGTDRWNVLKLPLVKGWNDITITAEDSAGNITVKKIGFDAVFK